MLEDIAKNKFSLIIYAGLALLLIIIAVACTYFIQDWRWSKKYTVEVARYEKQLAEINRVTNEKLKQQQEKQKKLQDTLTAVEQREYENLSIEKNKQYQLINDLVTARRRLSVATSSCSTSRSGLPSDPTSTRVDNETSRADIDSRDAAAIIAITSRGDEAIRQLTACQQILSEMTK